MPTPNLSIAFNLPPEAAVEYLSSRGMSIAGDWRAVAAAVRAGAFSVAGVLNGQVLDDIRQALQRALERGETYQDFLRNLRPRLQAAGWLGRWPADTETGEVLPGKGMTSSRLRTVFQTNLQGAYMAGRYKGMVENADQRPFWMYVAILDSHTRPRHRALHGRVFRWDDPIWQVIYPPNGYNCRCRVRALSQDDMEREGLHLSQGGEFLETIEIDLGGKRGKMALTGYRDPGTGEFFAADLGFDHNPAGGWGRDVALARSVTAIKSREIRAACWETLNDSPERSVAWQAMVEAVTSTRGDAIRRGGYDAHVLGFIDEDVADFARQMAPSAEPVRVVVMNGRALLHADADKHIAGGIALTPDQYMMLPGIVARPDAVYWDIAHGTMGFVRWLADGSAVWLPVAPGYDLRKTGWVDAAVNAYRMPAGNDGAGRLQNEGRFVRMVREGKV